VVLGVVMKKINVSIIINLLFLLFLFANFILQYDHLLVTRITSLVFAIVYLVIEVKKEYFPKDKMMFIIFSVVSIMAIIVSVLFDHATANSVTNNKVFLIPVYVFVLIVIMYKDLYDKKIIKEAPSSTK